MLLVSCRQPTAGPRHRDIPVAVKWEARAIFGLARRCTPFTGIYDSGPGSVHETGDW